MNLKKMGYELRQKQEALRAHKRVAKTKTTSEFEKEQRERSRGTSESEERYCQQRIKWLKKSSAEWDRELANIAKEGKREWEKEKKLIAALEKLGIVPDKRPAFDTSQPARLAEPPEKCQRRQTLDDAPQLETASPPSTPSTTADSQQNVGHSATRQSDDEPLGNPEVTPPSSVATSSTGDSQGSDAAPTGTAPSATAADILGGSGDLCDMCHKAGPLKPCGAGKLLKMRCESCDYGYTHLTKRVKPPEIQKNKAHLMNDPAGFAQLCNSEGRIHLQVYGEMRDKGVAVNSIAGKEYKARRIGELRQEVSMTREVRREGPGLKILPERAWIAHTKNTEGYDRVLDGVEEAKIMWDSAVQCNQLMKNEYGEWGLPVLVRGKTQTADIISKTAKFSQKDDVTDENREAMDAKLITPLVGPAAHGDGLYKQVGGNQLMSGVCPASYAPAVATQDSRGTLSSLRCVRLLDPQK